MTGSDLIARISAGTAPTILDVRSHREFASGHVPGALNVPFRELLRRVPAIPLSVDDPLVVYCRFGPRAWLAGAALRRHGFRRVEYLEGHMSEWQRAGLREET